MYVVLNVDYIAFLTLKKALLLKDKKLGKHFFLQYVANNHRDFRL